MKSIKVCEYSRSRSFHDDLILQDQASGEHSQDQWSSRLLSDRLSAVGPYFPGGRFFDDVLFFGYTFCRL